MSRINLYSQGRHIIIVDGYPLSGFAEGDFLQIKKDGNAAVRTHGGDGPSMNLSTEQGGTITLSLLPTSPALGQMYAIREGQVNNPRLFSIQMTSGVEELWSASGCAFGDMPQFTTGGPTMQPRQFSIEFLQMRMDTSAVTAVAGGLLGGLL
jgi:hypothetical protein